MHLPSNQSNQDKIKDLRTASRQKPINPKLKPNGSSGPLNPIKSLGRYTKVGLNRGSHTVILPCEHIFHNPKGRWVSLLLVINGEVRMRLPRVKGELP
jgi:hypothetical protein